MIDIDLDSSFALSEVEEEDFMDYYIRMDKILQLQREFLRDVEQVQMKMMEEEDELEYYVNMCEEDEPAFIAGYWR
jgi:hypothetical protein